jgi:hypothetical protein
MTKSISLPGCTFRTGVMADSTGKPLCSCGCPQLREKLPDKFDATICLSCRVRVEPTDHLKEILKSMHTPAFSSHEPTLSVGMAVVNDFQGMMFTAMSLRMQALQELSNPLEIIIVENQNTKNPCKLTQEFCVKAGFVYKHLTDRYGTSAPRDEVFKLATGKVVACVDSHIVTAPGTLKSIVNYYRKNPASLDLVQGPIVGEDGGLLGTHWAPKWRAGMFGTWESNHAAMKLNKPFEIPLMGLGLFAMRKEAWPGFHPLQRDFGGEEGYIHEKVRQRGGKCLCLPAAKWWHRFSKPAGGNYRNTWGTRVFNYLVEWMELGWDPHDVLDHFNEDGKQVAIQEALNICRSLNVEVPITRKVVTKPRAKLTMIRDAAYDDNIDTTKPAPMFVIPKIVTCVCPTFNRLGDAEQQALLEESIEAFLRQTYKHKRLVVLNDHPSQDAVFQHELVKVINTGKRFESLGDKHNALFAMADSDYICMWDDDDISLPFRLESLVELLGDADYYNPRRQWYLPGGLEGKLVHNHSHGVCFNSSIVKKQALRLIGMAPPTAASDMEMDGALASHGGVIKATTPKPLNPSQWSYIYRWGISRNHVSGKGNIDVNYQENALHYVPHGSFPLRPHWRKDYAAMVKAHLAENKLP